MLDSAIPKAISTVALLIVSTIIYLFSDIAKNGNKWKRVKLELEVLNDTMRTDKNNTLVHLYKDETGALKENTNIIQCYKKQSGVWAMWGKDASNNYICLEVGQTKDIFKELAYDLSYLEKDYSDVCIVKKYSARRLLEYSKKFDVCECDVNRTCAKYRDIASNYSDISVYLIHNSNVTVEKREIIELKYAIDNKALYWNAWGRQRKKARLYYGKALSVGQ